MKQITTFICARVLKSMWDSGTGGSRGHEVGQNEREESIGPRHAPSHLSQRALVGQSRAALKTPFIARPPTRLSAGGPADPFADPPSRSPARSLARSPFRQPARPTARPSVRPSALSCARPSVRPLVHSSVARPSVTYQDGRRRVSGRAPPELYVLTVRDRDWL